MKIKVLSTIPVCAAGAYGDRFGGRNHELRKLLVLQEETIMFSFYDSEACTKRCEFISGLTEEQYDNGMVTIQIINAVELEMDEDMDILDYMLNFTNQETGAKGTLTVTGKMYHELCAGHRSLDDRTFQVKFYADEDSDYYEGLSEDYEDYDEDFDDDYEEDSDGDFDGGYEEDAEEDFDELISKGIQITSVMEMVTRYTAD